MKNVINIFFVLILNKFMIAQVGIGTTTPDASAVLEIYSTNKGFLTPRLSNTDKINISSPSNGLLIYNTSFNNFQYNSGTKTTPVWRTLPSKQNLVSTDSENILSSGSDEGVYLNSTQYFGKFIINTSGNINITGLPFEPSMIKFTAYTNIETYNVDSDNGVGDNNIGIANSFGNTTGYAIKNGNNIEEQCIYIGGNANSINDISRYSSSSHCIGLRYSNQNGNSLGKTTATLISFNSNGFTLNIDNFSDNVVVIYEAYK